MQKIVIATNNNGKLQELKNMLSEYKILSLKEVNCNIEVEEDKETFEENAKKKAYEISKYTNMPTIADDSGLCIDYFNGWPGVYTARFLGDNSTQEERNNYILEKMKNLNDDQRNAKVVCYLVYYFNDKYIIGKGIIRGKIATKKRGSNGFGFDEIFELDNGKTLAELSNQEKNKVSARRLALVDLNNKLQK